jgi:hypothetical protein
MAKPLTKQEFRQSLADSFSAAVESTYKDLIEKAVLAEREACAKLAENGLIGHTIAQAIRARGEK